MDSLLARWGAAAGLAPSGPAPTPHRAPRRVRCAACRRLFWIPDTLPALPSAYCSYRCASAAEDGPDGVL